MELPDDITRRVLAETTGCGPIRLLVTLFSHGQERAGSYGERRVYWQGSKPHIARLAGLSKRAVDEAEDKLAELGFLARHNPTRPGATHAISAPYDVREDPNFCPPPPLTSAQQAGAPASSDAAGHSATSWGGGPFDGRVSVPSRGSSSARSSPRGVQNLHPLSREQGGAEFAPVQNLHPPLNSKLAPGGANFAPSSRARRSGGGDGDDPGWTLEENDPDLFPTSNDLIIITIPPRDELLAQLHAAGLTDPHGALRRYGQERCARALLALTAAQDLTEIRNPGGFVHQLLMSRRPIPVPAAPVRPSTPEQSDSFEDRKARFKAGPLGEFVVTNGEELAAFAQRQRDAEQRRRAVEAAWVER